MKAQAVETKIIADTARDALIASQGAYVTIGRKDGVVAEFIVPKDHPEQDAELVIYFQNTGHIPARVAWDLDETTNAGRFGLTYHSLGKGSTPLSPSARFKKGGWFETESSIIAGDSILVSTLGTISQPDLEALPHRVPRLAIAGYYAYCDQLGNWSTHLFGMRYRSNAPSNSLSFELANDDAIPNAPLPKAMKDREFFPPCTSTTLLAETAAKAPRESKLRHYPAMYRLNGSERKLTISPKTSAVLEPAAL